MTAEMPHHEAQEEEVLVAKRLHTGGTALYGNGGEIACVPHKGCALEILATVESPHLAVSRLLPGQRVNYRKRRKLRRPQLTAWRSSWRHWCSLAMLVVGIAGATFVPAMNLLNVVLVFSGAFLLNEERLKRWFFFHHRDWLELPDGSIVDLKNLIGFKFQLASAVPTPPPVETVPIRRKEDALVAI